MLSLRSTDPRVMPKNPSDPQQTTDVQELLESSEAFNPNVGVTIAPMSDNTHRRQHSNISKENPVTFYTFYYLFAGA